jgi:hypothetical protein
VTGAGKSWWKKFFSVAGKGAKDAGEFALDHPEILGPKVGGAVAIGKVVLGGKVRPKS